MARIKHLSVLLLSIIGLLATAQNQSGPDWPLHDNGLSTVVQWRHYSFQVHGQRIFIFSGEFHYWRIPVPELWRDILEKIKAAGFTAFAFYSSRAYHAPNNHTVDFLTFANSTLNTRPGSHNTLLVIHDDTGHDQTTGVLNPRGIIEARLLGSSTIFTHWRLAGTAGGESNLDPVRGVFVVDGLHAERVGWHLPGFDDSAWPVEKNNKNNNIKNQFTLSFSDATVRFFRTSIPLDIPDGLDVSISFLLGTPTGSSKAYRAQLFVNGYQYGRYHPHIGNQVVYPVPAGILDYRGENTIGLAVWAQSEEGAVVTVDWRVNYVADSSLDVVNVGDERLRPGRGVERMKYT